MSKTILIIGLILVLLLVGVGAGVFYFMRNSGPVTLTYWGLWEPESVYQEVIADYQRKHPGVTIKYQKVSQLNYRERLTSMLARDDGPDIVRIHNTWLPMMKNNLQAVPSDLYSSSTFKSTFYPVASEDLVSGGSAWAIPLEIDTLVMYVNENIMSAAGATAPSSWEDFTPTVAKLTVRDEAGKITTAGTALGTASNVDHWEDILSLMTLQSTKQTNEEIVVGNSPSAGEALAFYSSFASSQRIWDETLDGSMLAFASGKVGIFFAPSWRYFDIKEINPDLNFRVYPVPQLTGGTQVNLASYWAEGVSKKSAHAKEAFDFLKYLSSKEGLTKLYSAESKLRGFGEPYSRVDMASLLSTDPVTGVVAAQAPSAKSFYLASFTNDGETGINSRIGKYYSDAVNAMNASSGSSGDPAEVLAPVASGLAQVLGQYGITTSTSRTSN